MHKQANGIWADRYDRQIRFAPIGPKGQASLAKAQALVVGCGALGASLAQHLTRAGVGKVRIADRDYVEPSNLQRQVLFHEADALAALPKAVAAAEKLRAINGSIDIEALVMDVNIGNLAIAMDGADLVLDGTDNTATRLLLSEACFARNIPFVYGGIAGAEGMSAVLVPGETSCLRCLIGDDAEADEGQNCDTAGVLSAAVEFVASLQAVEAIKWLSGNRAAVRKSWITADLWDFSVRESALPGCSPGCRVCGAHAGEAGTQWIDASIRDGQAERNRDTGSHASNWVHNAAVALCGRDSVQVTLQASFQLDQWRDTFERRGYEYKANRYLLKVLLPEGERLVLFPDGRVLVQGVADPARALQLCASYLADPKAMATEEAKT
ncbi:thiamine biosynthesis protein ThiF [Paenibacillus sp. 1011MAR3C5]|uniref:ThiF family adenylyltransferase n=1 Tax=Paenibacillus sp. 1011MAR3C5 TaxID=1675787 RepID=UPI000E6B5D61|nr:ThiF family adenylyltransferase [Paenibacillus sp. 1011MAR3C5]RJE84652.1 thiamine biosynthesis protein ThiF [Paenibacillus sp. 1011MAR3C5]